MMWAGDKKQGINKCWPNVLVTMHGVTSSDISGMQVGSSFDFNS